MRFVVVVVLAAVVVAAQDLDQQAEMWIRECWTCGKESVKHSFVKYALYERPYLFDENDCLEEIRACIDDWEACSKEEICSGLSAFVPTKY